MLLQSLSTSSLRWYSLMNCTLKSTHTHTAHTHMHTHKHCNCTHSHLCTTESKQAKQAASLSTDKLETLKRLVIWAFTAQRVLNNLQTQTAPDGNETATDWLTHPSPPLSIRESRRSALNSPMHEEDSLLVREREITQFRLLFDEKHNVSAKLYIYEFVAAN